MLIDPVDGMKKLPEVVALVWLMVKPVVDADVVDAVDV